MDTELVLRELDGIVVLLLDDTVLLVLDTVIRVFDVRVVSDDTI